MEIGQVYSGQEFNTFGNKIVKALPYNLLDAGIQFQLGLNILAPLEPRSEYSEYDDEYEETCDGGCDFCEENDVGKHIRGYGYNVAYVTIPDDAQVHVAFSCGYIFTTDKIIIDRIVPMSEYFQDIEKCKAALRSNGNLIKFVENQTEELCEIAVRNRPTSIQFINNQTLNLLKIASERGTFVMSRKNQTPEFCIEAVKLKGSLLMYVEIQTPEICLEAVKKDGDSLQYVRYQTQEICLAAVRQYGYALQFVRCQTPEICHAAYIQCNHSYRYIADPELRAHYKWLMDAGMSPR